MKKIIALLLTCCMLFGYAACAEEAISERVFLNGATELLKSINLLRDMVRFDIGYLGNDVFSALVKADENLVDISASVSDIHLQVQASQADITIKSDETILNLQYADVEALVNAIVGRNASGLKIYGELLTLLFQNIIQPDMTIDTEDGLHITYNATAEQLMERLSTAVELIADDERYSAAADQIIQMISSAVGGELSSLSELKEEINRSKEQAKTTDFLVAFELIANADYTNIDITGEIGDSSDKYSMKWTYLNEDGAYKLDGLLWETRVLGEKTRKYEITISADFSGDFDHNSWSLDISHPTMGFLLNSNGRKEGSMGSIYINFSAPSFGLSSRLLLQLDYATGEDGLIASAYYNAGGMGTYFASLMATEKQLDLSVRSYSGQNVFLLKLLANDNKHLEYGYMEYTQFNMYQNRPGDQITAEFDGEKLVINEHNITITCTGAFESDHEYVITLHAEGEYVIPGEENAYIRIGYEGEEGNFSIYGRAYAPNDEKASLSAVFSCTPTEGISTILRDDTNVIRLTPETLLMMMGQ